jgi:peptidyl-prolyl cis-trans isomerase D
MFEFVRSNSRLVHVFLFLVAVPTFGLMGLQGYSRFMSEESTAVATVDGRNISRAEWDDVHRKQIERIKQQAPNIDVAMFDTPAARYQTLQSIVRERVLVAAANDQHLILTDAQLKQDLMAIPELAQLRKADGSFDVEGYRNLLQGVGLTPETFEANYRQNAASQRVLASITQSGMLASAAAQVSMQAQAQERAVQLMTFATGAYLSRVQLQESDLNQYYQEHKEEFRTIEQADIEYVVLSGKNTQALLQVSEDEIAKSFEDNKARYTTPEQRRASHILVKVDKSAGDDAIAKAKVKAQSLLEQVRQSPKKFAELARSQSDDPGSAAKGGDLDYFGRGAMVKPFEDAVFSMNVDAISDLVETDFGFHIIRLDAIKPASTKPLESVRAEIEASLRDELGKKRYSEWAEQFTNMVYEQSDSLEPVAKKFQLSVQTASVTRKPQPGAQGALASSKLLEAVFADDVARNKRNTDAIEIAANELAAARVVTYKPSVIPSLEEIKPQVEVRLRTRRARELAVKEGQDKLEALKKSDSLEGFQPETTFSRKSSANQPKELMNAVLKAKVASAPVLVGVSLGDAGFTIARINKVTVSELTKEEVEKYDAQWKQDWVAAESALYYNALKRRYKVKIRVPQPAKEPI